MTVIAIMSGASLWGNMTDSKPWLEALGLSLIELESFREIEDHGDVPESFDRWRKYDKDGAVYRPASSVLTLGVHHTGVRGGFGLTKSQLAAAGGNALQGRAKRYRNLPYHAVCSPKDSASIIQWPWWMYTHHGNGMNRYTIGWAIDLDSRFDEFDLGIMVLAGMHVVSTFRDLGCPLLNIETHSQHAQKPSDPGLAIMRGVLMPLAKHMNMTINGSVHTGKGRAWSLKQYT